MLDSPRRADASTSSGGGPASPDAWTAGDRIDGLDLSDELFTRRRRARVAVVFLLLGVPVGLVVTVQVVTDPFERAASMVALLAQLLTIGVLVRRRRPLGDRGYVLVHLWITAALTAGLYYSTPVHSLRSTELVLLGPTAASAVFCATRRQAAVAVAACVLGANLITSRRLQGLPDAWAEVVGEILTFAFVALTVRILRESSHRAVIDAKRREVTDPLTGLANRRGFEREGGRVWRRRATDHGAVAVIAVDIDHFKKVNDTFGHAAGDQLLRRLAQVLSDSLREGDVAVRLGGEEFAVLAPASPGEALQLAERLRARIEDELTVTVSIGVTELVPDHPGTDEQAVEDLWRATERADRALYEAKRGGRNRVVVSAAG